MVSDPAQSVRAASSAQDPATIGSNQTPKAAPALQLARGGGGGGGGGGFGGGAGMHAIGPGGGAGFRSGNYGAGGARFAAPGSGTRFVTPGAGLPPPAYARQGVQPLSGAHHPRAGSPPHAYARQSGQSPSSMHYPRYRYQHRGFRYYHQGWWYAFPWWIESEPDSCDYSSNVCASQWGYGSDGYYSCMSSYGCY